MELSREFRAEQQEVSAHTHTETPHNLHCQCGIRLHSLQQVRRKNSHKLLSL